MVQLKRERLLTELAVGAPGESAAANCAHTAAAPAAPQVVLGQAYRQVARPQACARLSCRAGAGQLFRKISANQQIVCAAAPAHWASMFQLVLQVWYAWHHLMGMSTTVGTLVCCWLTPSSRRSCLKQILLLASQLASPRQPVAVCVEHARL